MISVVEHIEYLITRHDCVIVPGWGAFIAQYNSSYCDADGVNWHRPVREISFNPELVHNDGLLVNSVVSKEKCTFGVANDIVHDDVAMLCKQINEDRELAFGNIGFFKLINGKVQFKPYSSKEFGKYEFYGLRSFSMEPLALRDRKASVKNNSWKFSISKNYLKIAASILVLLALSLVLTTPISVKNDNQNYASFSSNFKLTGGEPFAVANEVKELAITMPPIDNDDIIVKAYPSMGKKRSGGDYYLIVCSVLSQAEADKFISCQSGNYDYEVLAKGSKYRVYVAAGNSVKELISMKNEIADDYPDAWVYHNR